MVDPNKYIYSKGNCALLKKARRLTRALRFTAFAQMLASGRILQTPKKNTRGKYGRENIT